MRNAMADVPIISITFPGLEAVQTTVECLGITYAGVWPASLESAAVHVVNSIGRFRDELLVYRARKGDQAAGVTEDQIWGALEAVADKLDAFRREHHAPDDERAARYYQIAQDLRLQADKIRRAEG